MYSSSTTIDYRCVYCPAFVNRASTNRHSRVTKSSTNQLTNHAPPTIYSSHDPQNTNLHTKQQQQQQQSLTHWTKSPTRKIRTDHTSQAIKSHRSINRTHHQSRARYRRCNLQSPITNYNRNYDSHIPNYQLTTNQPITTNKPKTQLLCLRYIIKNKNTLRL